MPAGNSSRVSTSRGHDHVVTDDGTRAAYDLVAAKYEERFVDELRHKPRDRELLAARPN